MFFWILLASAVCGDRGLLRETGVLRVDSGKSAASKLGGPRLFTVGLRAYSRTAHPTHPATKQAQLRRTTSCKDVAHRILAETHSCKDVAQDMIHARPRTACKSRLDPCCSKTRRILTAVPCSWRERGLHRKQACAARSFAISVRAAGEPSRPVG